MIRGIDFINYLEEDRYYSELTNDFLEQRMFDDGDGTGTGTAILGGAAALAGGFAAAKHGMLGNTLRKHSNNLWGKAGHALGSNSMMNSGAKGASIAEANLKTGVDGMKKGVKNSAEWNESYLDNLNKTRKEYGLKPVGKKIEVGKTKTDINNNSQTTANTNSNTTADTSAATTAPTEKVAANNTAEVQSKASSEFDAKRRAAQDKVARQLQAEEEAVAKAERLKNGKGTVVKPTTTAESMSDILAHDAKIMEGHYSDYHHFKYRYL